MSPETSESPVHRQRTVLYYVFSPKLAKSSNKIMFFLQNLFLFFAKWRIFPVPPVDQRDDYRRCWYADTKSACILLNILPDVFRTTMPSLFFYGKKNENSWQRKMQLFQLRQASTRATKIKFRQTCLSAMDIVTHFFCKIFSHFTQFSSSSPLILEK